ncbi:hypothetical protein [Nocardia barduliensis]|uniref:hypothetical protein n=1 Tax=Nocardia barduliensis TaxID=2736643 RepID=UPI00157322D5|nr:hypothetical protein [Nocardia barduliensis]
MNTNTVARLEGVESFSELLAVLDELRVAHGPARLLCTLDDVDQCLYTSMHAAEDDRLWFEEVEDDKQDPVARHRIDNARTAYIAAALEDHAHRIRWDALAATRTGGAAQVAALVEVNRTPDRALDDVVLVQRVPVAADDLTIAGIPNGYFTGDWDVFQNHAVVRRMAAHGYRHFGIGAALLAFDRPAAPTMEEARAVVTDLVHLYGAGEATGWPELASLISRQRLLVLGYTEGFTDALDG